MYYIHDADSGYQINGRWDFIAAPSLPACLWDAIRYATGVSINLIVSDDDNVEYYRVEGKIGSREVKVLDLELERENEKFARECAQLPYYERS